MTGALAAIARAKSRIVNLPASLGAEDLQASPALAASAVIRIKRDGTYQCLAQGVVTSSGDWVSPKHSTVGDFYNVKYDYTGSMSSGPADNSYVQVDTDREWTLTQGPTGSISNSGTITIQRRADSATTTPGGDSCSASMSATYI